MKGFSGSPFHFGMIREMSVTGKDQKRTPSAVLHGFIHHETSKRTVNYMAYIVGVGGNVAVIPQIIKAWQSDAPGLAVLTWLLFIGISLMWLVYAIQQHQKPLIIAQITGLACNIAVVLGWVVNNWLR